MPTRPSPQWPVRIEPMPETIFGSNEVLDEVCTMHDGVHGGSWPWSWLYAWRLSVSVLCANPLLPSFRRDLVPDKTVFIPVDLPQSDCYWPCDSWLTDPRVLRSSGCNWTVQLNHIAYSCIGTSMRAHGRNTPQNFILNLVVNTVYSCRSTGYPGMCLMLIVHVLRLHVLLQY